MEDFSKKIYIYNNIDNIDYLVGELCIHAELEDENPYFTFKYDSNWLKNKYAYPLNFQIPLGESLYKIPIAHNCMMQLRQCYVNEVDYFYEFFIIYLIKNKIIDSNRTDLNKLYEWFKYEISIGPKFSYRFDKYKIIPLTINFLNQNDFTRCGSLRLKQSINGNFCKEISPKLIPHINNIDNIFEIIDKIKNNTETQEELEQFAACASSLNGFQPKINVYDNEGNLCIAKLSSLFKNDFHEMQREILAYHLAKKSGIYLQEYFIETTKSGDKYILLKRFDRDKDKRIPFIYFSDLENTDKIFKYPEKVINVVKNICLDNYEKNLKEIFKRLFFRIMVGNVSDMFPNTAFLFSSDKGWNLSPDFDITCGYYKYSDLEKLRQKQLRNKDFRIGMANDLINNAYLYKVEKKEIEEIVSNLKHAFEDWRSYANSIGLEEDDIIRLAICEEVTDNIKI